MSYTKLTGTRGDTLVWDFTATPPAGGAFDTPIDAAVFTVRRKVGGTLVVTKTMLDGVAITATSTEVLATVTLEPADTSSLTASQLSLVYDLQITEDDGRVTTIARGPLVLAADITT